MKAGEGGIFWLKLLLRLLFFVDEKMIHSGPELPSTESEDRASKAKDYCLLV